jgi:hypothetical protein
MRENLRVCGEVLLTKGYAAFERCMQATKARRLWLRYFLAHSKS